MCFILIKKKKKVSCVESQFSQAAVGNNSLGIAEFDRKVKQLTGCVSNVFGVLQVTRRCKPCFGASCVS